MVETGKITKMMMFNIFLNLFWEKSELRYFCTPQKTVAIAQLVRASDCGSEGRRFEPG